MKLIITTINPYKEKDGIITGFNDSGTFSILVKGILNPKNKNACINNPMTIADIELNENIKSKYDVLKSAELIFTPLELIGGLSNLAMVMLLNELIVKCLNDDERQELYKDIYGFLKGIKKNKNVRFTYLHIIAKMLHNSGFSFDVDECTACGSKKDIVGFSLSDGGFICKQCLINFQDSSYSKEELIWLRRIFKTNVENKTTYDQDIEKSSFTKILKTMLIFIEDNYGLKIKNTELIID